MRILLAVLAFAAAGCVSQSAVETKPVTDSGVVDARRRAEVHTALAGEYYARGNYAIALAETRRAIKEDANYFPAHNMQALIYMELREDAQARESFGHALRLSPNNPEVLNNYGWFQCVRGDPQRGLELLQKASADPLYQSPEKAFVSTGLCFKRLNRNPEAEEYLRRAVLIQPNMITALYNLAYLTFERGAYKDSENYLVRYMRLASPTLESLVLGVKLARISGDRQAEESYLQQLRRRHADAPEAKALLEGAK